MVFKVGKGNKIIFWTDPWCGNNVLSQSFPNLFAMVAQRNATVEEMWDQNFGQGGWNLRFFAWEAAWRKVLTLDRLQRRGWQFPNCCFLCGCEEETINHILIHCTVVRIL